MRVKVEFKQAQKKEVFKVKRPQAFLSIFNDGSVVIDFPDRKASTSLDEIISEAFTESASSKHSRLVGVPLAAVKESAKLPKHPLSYDKFLRLFNKIAKLEKPITKVTLLKYAKRYDEAVISGELANEKLAQPSDSQHKAKLNPAALLGLIKFHRVRRTEISKVCSENSRRYRESMGLGTPASAPAASPALN